MVATYLLVGFGVVLGYAIAVGHGLWRRAQEERRRQEYFRDVDALARQGKVS